MKRLIICTTALLTMSLGNFVQAQNFQSNQSDNKPMNMGKQKRGGQMHKIMRESMQIIRTDMQAFRKANKAKIANLKDSLKDKTVAEIISILKKRRTNRFKSVQSQFKKSFAKAKSHFQSEVAKLYIDNDIKNKAIARFDKMQEKRSEFANNMFKKQMAFLDTLASDSSMTPKKLHQAIKAERQKIRNQMQAQRKNKKQNRKHLPNK